MMHGRARKQYAFRAIFSAIRFDEKPFTHLCEEESKKALEFQQGFRLHTFIGCFQATV